MKCFESIAIYIYIILFLGGEDRLAILEEGFEPYPCHVGHCIE